MNARNPFAPSRATLDAAADAPNELRGDQGVWREGRVIVLSPDAALPRRCVKCNQPAHEPTQTRKVYWHSPWLYLLILFNLIIYAIVALAARKKALVAPGLCVDHKKRRRNALAVGWLGFLFGFVLLFIGLGTDVGPWGPFLGVVVMLASVIVGMIKGRIVYASRIDKTHVRLKGCGQPFLDSLPPFPG